MASVAAAAVLGLCVKPSQKGEARKLLLAGELRPGDSDATDPAVGLRVESDGTVTLCRRGLSGSVHASGAVSLAVTVAGFDIIVEERIVQGHAVEDVPEPDEAVFSLDFLGPEHYHMRYYSEATGGMAAIPLHVRPGIQVSRKLI